MIDFSGQVAVVTGGGRGLGRLYALELAKRGASVVVNDLGGDSLGAGADSSVAGQVVAEIKAGGGKAVASTDSVGTPAGGKAIIDAALDTFGRVDIVINNAGIVAFTPFEDIEPKDLQRMLNVHIEGAFYVSQPAFRAMKNQDYGRFVFVSSSAGLLGQVGNAHYGAAKGGVAGLTHVLAVEGAPYNILANSILPTGRTRMADDQVKDGHRTPGQAAFFEAMRPELITPLVVYLASRDCKPTHQHIAAFAGRYARVFLGYSEGWLSEKDSTPSVEDIAERIDQITATTKFSVPNAQIDELLEVCAQRGIKLF